MTLLADPLDPQGEAEWSRLHRYLELAEGFWIGFIFTASPAAAEVFRNRTERFLRARVWSFRRIHPKTPEALRETLQTLFEPASLEAGCVWVEGLEVDQEGKKDGPWMTAWDALFLRLNERRERLLRHARGGLVFAAPVAVKPRVRDAAPDLWSIRGIVLEPPPVAFVREPDRLEAGLRDRSSETPRRAATARQTDPPPVRAGNLEALEPLDRAAALLREAQGLLALAEPDQAREPAVAAVALLRETKAARGEVDLAHALALLGRIEAASGDPGAATEHLEEACRLQQQKPSRELLQWLDTLGTLAVESSELQRAGSISEESLQIARRLVTDTGETPQSLRDLSVSLDRLGDVRSALDELSAATAAYEESLQIRRRLLAEPGETVQSLRDLLVSLIKLGDVRSASGKLPAAAAAAAEESLQIARRLIVESGETPLSLRDLSVSLERVGDVRRASGDLSAATAASEESLQIRRRLLAESGETPQSLQDLSVSLARIGDMREKSGELARAVSAFEEALSLERKFLDLYGENPRARQHLEFGQAKLAALRAAGNEQRMNDDGSC